MEPSDAVAIFAEDTFEEQVKELATYITNQRPENERGSILNHCQELLKAEKDAEDGQQQREEVLSFLASEVKGLGDGSDREAEGFFNLLVSNLIGTFQIGAPKLHQHIESIAEVLSHKTGPEHHQVQYRVFSNLFNVLPRRSNLRLIACKYLIKFAVENDEVDVLDLSPANVERWVEEWGITQTEKCDFLKSIIAALAAAERLQAAFDFNVLLARTVEESADQAESVGLDAIVAALRLPNVIDFESLLNLTVISKLKSHPLHSLLLVYITGSLADYRGWEKANPDVLVKFGLDPSVVERKIRILALSSLGFKNIGRDIPYSEIAAALQIEISQVERWVIDVIRVGLLSGKLSQTNQTLHVVRASPSSFGRDQWEILEKKLTLWRAGINNVMTVLTSTRQGLIDGVGHSSMERTQRPQVPVA